LAIPATHRQNTPVRTVWARRRLARLALLVAVLLGAVRTCVLRPGTTFPGSHFNRGANATWLDIDWVNEPKPPATIDALAQDLERQQVRDAFVYVSYLKDHGAFNPTYAHAAPFLRAIKAAAPGVRVQGWIGLPLRTSAAFGPRGYVDLADPAVRAVVARFCAEMVGWGFDGVHLDPEPIPDGDPSLLALLDDVRAAIGPRAILSISTPRAWPMLAEAPWPRVGPVWGAAYYRQVAARVNQVAVMTYDSYMPTPLLYRLWQRHQVVEVSRALDGTGVDVFVGVPTSEEATRSHRPAAENMATGILGVVDGLNDAAARPGAITGVAIYPHWETDEGEWRTYRALWVGS
jgi:hypothetical protein